MRDLKELEEIGKTAVKELRAQKLANGLPFMINSNDLPSTQCYIEYPDGHISLVSLISSRLHFNIIRNLSNDEIIAVKKKHNLTEGYA